MKTEANHMEYIDILDEKGNKTGESKPKPDIHRGGDWHRAVHLWLLNSKGEFLLQHRSKTIDSYPDFWDTSAAGHISLGEESIPSTLREAKEELGIQLKPDQLILIGEVTQQIVLNDNTYFNNEFNDIYLVKMDIDSSLIKLEDGEVSEVKWIHWKDLKKMIETGGEGLVPHPEEYDLLFKYCDKELT